MGFNTYLRPGTRGLYNLYVVDPSEQQIRLYSPAADGSGFPAPPTGWLLAARDVAKMTSTYVDGDFFVADGGQLVRFVGGNDEGWTAKAPKDTVLRPAPSYSIVSSGSARRLGEILGYDQPNGRIVAIGKSDGAYHAQYRLAGGLHDWSDVRGMYVVTGGEGEPSTLVWLSSDGINQAVLVAVPGANPGPSGSPSSNPSGSPLKTTPKPSKKP